MSFTQDFFTSRTNLVDGTTKIGQLNRLWYEPQTNTIRVGNGQPGGLLVGGVGGQVNSDWNSSSGITQILNKPTALSQFDNDTNYVSTGYNPFNQDLNTYNTVSFDDINGSGTLYVSNITSPDYLDLVIRSHYDNTGTLQLYGDRVEIFTTSNPLPAFQVDQYGQIKMLTPTFDQNAGSLSIVGSADGSYIPPTSAGAMLHITGQPGTVSRMYNDASNNYGLFVTRRYNGSSAAPTMVRNGDIISRIAANGYNGSSTNAGFPLLGPARIEFIATEDFTTSGIGGNIDFYTTANGSVTPVRKLSVSNAGIIFSDNTIQDTAAIPLTYLGNANGVATLGNDGKVPASQLNIAGSVVYKGSWDASSNTPYLHNDTGTVGWEYKVTSSGTVDFGAGDITFGTGDWVIYNGSIWEKIPGTVGVTAFNNRIGDVTLSLTDVNAALGYTPYSSSNPAGYITLVQIPPNVSTFNGRYGAVTLLSSDVVSALSTGSIQNAKLANSSITIHTGEGLNGGGTVALGGSITLSSTVAAYSLPTASNSVLGGVKIGSGLSIDGNSVLSTNASQYTLPIASTSTLGGIKVGAGLTIDGTGILSTATTLDSAGFYDTSSQSIANIANAYPVILNSSFKVSPTITISSNSYINVSHNGYYHFEYSLQMINPNNSQHDVTVWFRKNDADIPYSGSVFTLPPRINAGLSSKLIAACPFDVELSAGDKLQVMWWVDVTNITIETVAAGTNPSRPASPGVIINVRRIA